MSDRPRDERAVVVDAEQAMAVDSGLAASRHSTIDYTQYASAYGVRSIDNSSQESLVEVIAPVDQARGKKPSSELEDARNGLLALVTGDEEKFSLALSYARVLIGTATQAANTTATKADLDKLEANISRKIENLTKKPAGPKTQTSWARIAASGAPKTKTIPATNTTVTVRNIPAEQQRKSSKEIVAVINNALGATEAIAAWTLQSGDIVVTFTSGAKEYKTKDWVKKVFTGGAETQAQKYSVVVRGLRSSDIPGSSSGPGLTNQEAIKRNQEVLEDLR